MNKLIITRWKNSVVAMLLSGKEAIQLDIDPEEGNTLLGNIYIGKVTNVVKNINSAFVDVGNGQMGYLNLSDSSCYYADGRKSNGMLRQGDEVIVQVERDAVKTKAPVLTGNLNIPGRYVVLTSDKTHIGFSGKITDDKWKQDMKFCLEKIKDDNFGIIVRTNAYQIPWEELEAEINHLKARLKNILENGTHRTCYSLLYQSAPTYLAGLRDSLKNTIGEVVTDEADIYETVREYFSVYQPENLKLLTFYNDNLLPMNKLYRLEKILENAMGKRVWLKSGGYLVIEPTEALVVIDVNTGKFSGKKALRETIMKVNLEAAEEIGHQIRLRNLSGIIIIDFIDMEKEEDREILLQKLREIFGRDPVKTVVVEITKLNLVEITRKKIKRPLHEQVAGLKQ